MFAMLDPSKWGENVDKNTAAQLFARAGCRVAGFGCGCGKCPFKKTYGMYCRAFDDDDLLVNCSALYYTNAKYRESVNVEINGSPALRKFLRTVKVV